MELLTPMETTALLLSLRVAGVAIALGLPVAVLAAWVLGRYSFPGKTLVDGLVHLPLVLPPVVTGYILLVTMGTKGVVGGWLYQTFGIKLIFTAEGASLAVAVTSFPLMVRAIRLSVEAIDGGLEAAARTLGAGPVDRFFTILLPLMAPGLLSGAIVAFAAAMGEFGAVITFVSNIPGKTQTLPLAIYAATQEPGGDAVAARLATISFGVALLALMLSEFLANRVRRLIGQV
ncbi:molybdate ABC transporter permease subunit [Azospirillum sp. CT11-132]|jgi:molybdate transport system permease protein|uniref:molybdate ABC transporter permease subunit n=1 Tax=unclassified Azospirillum TaxID=2630922 RepID=UPI000D6123EE|nr:MULTISPECIES: molybdate ABC transporter permease subunit [unclassified Azospirillum]MCM8733689.1 molybdate ABC transporter permease subunit [Azospirillum sp. A1-3]PWC62446.1 molybdenum ABC transporter permease [Azospirillum sp. TSH7]PWC66564.1 molybdenum ABC transporter permease [Azospirillum sp. TSH20]PWC96431.1 molybdenum ABC transporter permease [Azospirillum sp. TSO5]QCG98750.1 molybdate ABC transporter permease subunit [Azospirillum sp. TSA2s]